MGQLAALEGWICLSGVTARLAELKQIADNGSIYEGGKIQVALAPLATRPLVGEAAW